MSGHGRWRRCGAAHDPDAYCAAEAAATTAKEALLGNHHRRAVRADALARPLLRHQRALMPRRSERWWLRTSTRTSRGCLSRLVERKAFASSSTTTRAAGTRRAPRCSATPPRRAPTTRRAAGGAAGRAAGRAAQRWRRGAALRVVRQRELRRPQPTTSPSSTASAPRLHSPMDVVQTPRGDVCSTWQAYLDLNGWPSCADRLYTTEGTLRCMAPRSARPLAAPRCPSAAPRRRRLRVAHARVSRIWASGLAPGLGAAPPAALRLRLLRAVVARPCQRCAGRSRSSSGDGSRRGRRRPAPTGRPLSLRGRTIVGGADERDWRGRRAVRGQLAARVDSRPSYHARNPTSRLATVGVRALRLDSTSYSFDPDIFDERCVPCSAALAPDWVPLLWSCEPDSSPGSQPVTPAQRCVGLSTGVRSLCCEGLKAAIS